MRRGVLFANCVCRAMCFPLQETESHKAQVSCPAELNKGDAGLPLGFEDSNQW